MATLQDPELRRRLLDAARAGVAAGVAIQKGPKKQKRRSRGKWLLLLAGVGAYVATSEPASAQLLKLVGEGTGDTAPAS